MFLQASVILSTGKGGLPQCMLGYHPPRADTPRSTHPPGADPQGADPPGADTPPGSRQQTTPPGADTPRHRVCWEIQSTRGRYASYWNAILLQ